PAQSVPLVHHADRVDPVVPGDVVEGPDGGGRGGHGVPPVETGTAWGEGIRLLRGRGLLMPAAFAASRAAPTTPGSRRAENSRCSMAERLAARTLSIRVHPPEATARRRGPTMLSIVATRAPVSAAV